MVGTVEAAARYIRRTKVRTIVVHGCIAIADHMTEGKKDSVNTECDDVS